MKLITTDFSYIMFLNILYFFDYILDSRSFMVVGPDLQSLCRIRLRSKLPHQLDSAVGTYQLQPQLVQKSSSLIIELAADPIAYIPSYKPKSLQCCLSAGLHAHR
jgi:hypothetical protein